MDFKTINLTQGKTTVIDLEDYPRILTTPYTYPYQRTTKIHWKAEEDHTRNGQFYAVALLQPGAKTKRFKIRMHRWILCPPDDMVIDHIDGDGLNNRKDNLRICTMSGNSMNSKPRKSKYPRGIQKIDNGYVARIGYQNKRYYLGYYKTLSEAVKAYTLKAKELFGAYVY